MTYSFISLVSCFILILIKPAVAAQSNTKWDNKVASIRGLSEEVVGTEIEHDNNNGRIYGGTAASSGEYPAFALLCYNGDTTTCGTLTNRDYSCGGTFVASQYVVTAGHCVVSVSGTQLSITGVRIGASQTQSDGTYAAVLSVTIHPDFVYTVSPDFMLRNDVAVLKLASAVSGVTPWSFNKDSAYPSINDSPVTAIGYGYYSTSNTISTYLRKASLKFQLDGSCSSSAASSNEVVCAVGTSTGPCAYDSGGPLLDSNNLILGWFTFRNGQNPCDGGEKSFYTESSYYATWIDEQIGVSTTTAPTPAPTLDSAAVTDAPTCSCFSESTTVEVLDQEAPLEMKELKVGQQIFAGVDKESGRPSYETVYGFAHRDENQQTEYLRITTSSSSNKTATTNRTLEITSNHLIFLQKQKDPVPAGSLKVGDVLIHQSINQKEAESATITSVKVVRRRGLYAPLTNDGTVIVDGIQASSYVSIKESNPRVIATTAKLLMSEQTFLHWWMAPYRFVCTRVSPQMCLDDYSKEVGYIHWLVLGKKFGSGCDRWADCGRLPLWHLCVVRKPS